LAPFKAGVDVPTVARWLGHKDGGALLMKTYSHLLQEHSQAMAAPRQPSASCVRKKPTPTANGPAFIKRRRGRLGIGVTNPSELATFS